MEAEISLLVKKEVIEFFSEGSLNSLPVHNIGKMAESDSITDVLGYNIVGSKALCPLASVLERLSEPNSRVRVKSYEDISTESTHRHLQSIPAAR